ncbi:hypothetical protein B9G69_007645 [Bdellovibrio sp. SKB1291214]|uniref:hypothetical protein n=1 Tax=Bdellovibrio sp. SKB1291214 TaxID=1732569 RepID=UPI0015956845|nr:hypothetical protein [Bdellovibrio sp. SKB1291214]UYL10452.1 hypothetical protein B9G69_007645 [Bdellovibrio sp. SKB1291214]
MKAIIAAAVIFAVSSTSFAATGSCGSRSSGSLFKKTAATTSNIVATTKQVTATKAVR